MIARHSARRRQSNPCQPMRVRSQPRLGARRVAGRRAAGISLIEVLTSLLLVAVIMPVALRGIALASAATALAAHRTQATALASMKLNELLLSDDLNDVPQDEQADDENWPGYRWRNTVSNWADDQTIKQLDVTVRWTDRDREYQLTMSTLMHQAP